MPGSLASLDTASSSSDYSYDSDDEEYRLALQEWEESVEQLQQLLSIVIFPYLGRWIGRKWSYWGGSCMLLVILHSLIIPSVCPLPAVRAWTTLFLWRENPEVLILP